MILGDSFPVSFFCNLNQINIICSIMKFNSKQLRWLIQSNSCFFIMIPGAMSVLSREHRDCYIDGPCFQTIFPLIVTMLKLSGLCSSSPGVHAYYCADLFTDSRTSYDFLFHELFQFIYFGFRFILTVKLPLKS